LKVPKHENFELAFFTLSDPPFWVGELVAEAKNRFFYQFTPDLYGFFIACIFLSLAKIVF
jgi:hypothetical protein